MQNKFHRIPYWIISKIIFISLIFVAANGCEVCGTMAELLLAYMFSSILCKEKQASL